MILLRVIRVQGKEKVVKEINLPVNVLVFCTELDFTEDDFSKKIIDSNLVKSSVEVELDVERIPSIQKLKEMFENSSSLTVYKLKELSKGHLYAGTQFIYKKGKTIAYIKVEVNDPKNSKVEVLSEKKGFADAIINDITKVIKK